VTAAIDVRIELEDLRASAAALAALRVELGDGGARRVESVSGWSVDEHLYHLCLATDLALRNVQSLARAKGGLITSEGGPNALALQVLSEGVYPRGESEAPRMVRPPDEVDAALLDQEVELLGQSFERVPLDRVPGAPGRIPHQHLGELCAAEWLRFARLHARHHLAIVRDVAAELGP